ADLFGGKLMGIVATSALELGVDVGGLDAVVMSGYPGTVASFRQQLGRTGRSTNESLAVLIAGENQLDQWICDNPTEIFERPAERATVSLDNPHLFVPHLGCASHEFPLTSADSEFWPSQLDEGVRQLVTSDRCRISERVGPSGSSEPAVSWIGRGSPAPTISLRSSGQGEFRIVHAQELEPDTPPQLIGTIPEASLYTAAHLGAIYLHQGSAWKVTDIDEATRCVTVERDAGDTYTLARSTKSVSILRTDDSIDHAGWRISIGSVRVSTVVTGYQIRSVATHEVIGREALDVPDSTLLTRAIWYTFDDDFIAGAGIDPPEVAGSLHAAEHAAIGLLPLFAICDRWDVGGLSTPSLGDTKSPAIIIHDAFQGGSGMAEMAFEV
ncbi:MAG: DUF1998 domain-containing protein, partial [Microthrixaceae bacterium]|nr:DUF1998 domain-containing protein [Microthrixaceae bacterium]